MDLALFIGALAAFIILHELGHFVACLVCGVEVEEFGIGFPPRIASLRIKNIDFSLNWILLGGFVRPKGENDTAIAGGLAASNPWKRLAVMFAGPVMNILAAIVLYSLAFSQMGLPQTDKVLVVEVAANSPAQQAGLQADDLLMAVNGHSIESITAIQTLINANLGKEITLTYERNSKPVEVRLIPRSNPPAGQGAIGIAMTNPTHPVTVFEALPYGSQAVIDQAYLLFSLPVRFIQGTVPAEQMRVVGFKGMYDIYQGVRDVEASQTRTRGVASLAFFAMITASLGILNLLPVPALDGGRILFVIPELALHRRVPAHLENALHMAGFMILLGLLVYVNLQDFINPVQLGSVVPTHVPTPPVP